MMDRLIKISMVGSCMSVFVVILTLALTAVDLHGRAGSLYLFADGIVQTDDTIE
jgi:hypothetical protein